MSRRGICRSVGVFMQAYSSSGESTWSSTVDSDVIETDALNLTGLSGSISHWKSSVVARGGDWALSPKL